MRTTVDIPDSLMSRIKGCLAERRVTFRTFVITALEQTLRKDDGKSFRLRDASVGEIPPHGETISNDAINRAIDEQRHPAFKG